MLEHRRATRITMIWPTSLERSPCSSSTAGKTLTRMRSVPGPAVRSGCLRRLGCPASGASPRKSALLASVSLDPGFRKCEECRAAVFLAGKLTREWPSRYRSPIDRRAYAGRLDEQREHLVLAGRRLVLRHSHDVGCAKR